MTPGRPGRGEAGCRAGRAGRPVPPGVRAGRSLVPRWSWGGLGFKRRASGGGVAFPPGAAAASRSMHSSTIERDRAGLAVSRVSGVRSSARPRRIGSVVELCMSVAPRPVPGTTAPTSRCPPLSARSPGPARGATAPTLRCPPLSARSPSPARGATAPTSRRSPLSARSPSPGQRNANNARPARKPGGTGPMDAERSEAQNPRAAANPGRARAGSAGAARSRVRSGSARGGRRGHSLPDGRMNRSSAGSLSACGM